MEITLASSSPRRRELLQRMGLHGFRVVASDEPEVLNETLPPEVLVQTLSAQKARAVQGEVGMDDLIIAADTVVVRNGKVLGKPSGAQEAIEMLRSLSAHRHQVYTGVTVLCGERAETEYEMTEVTFRPLRPEEIAAYVQTGEPLDKAGAYGIQGYGAMFVRGIFGDYYNVVGLPICRLSQMLQRFGVDCLVPDAARSRA
ncbi:MAG: Maf family protein [Oscillospiraceae bacterium]|nr:Maf family protein [Oscillospiraceae bacterium]